MDSTLLATEITVTVNCILESVMPMGTKPTIMENSPEQFTNFNNGDLDWLHGIMR